MRTIVTVWRAGLVLALIAFLALPWIAPVRASTRPAGQVAADPLAGRPVVREALHYDTSPALQRIKPLAAQALPLRSLPLRRLPKVAGGHPSGLPPVGLAPLVQTWPGSVLMPAPVANFEGVNNVNSVLPPDTNGDIGYDPATGKKYYVQWVNLSFKIWDVTNSASPVSLYGPAAGNTLWNGFGGICESHNDGDPIVLFDHLANRWLMTQFALSFPDDFHECVAVSASADPLGAWHRYDFFISDTKMNDYPKFGVWPDGYYMSVNQFDGSSLGWAGAGAAVLEREKMLAGQPARMLYFDVGAVTLDYGGMLPADLDGPSPPAGAPNIFVEWDDSSWLGDPQDTLRLWKFQVDWTNPANSAFGANANFDPNRLIPTANVNPDLCGYDLCIPQPGGSPLDPISDRLMFRLQYRNFGAYQTLVSNHTVDVGGADHAGIHWFELRDSGTGWTLHQDGVYAPDSLHRWMGSLAMDTSGNMALGYSVSSNTVSPSIRYTGRLIGDPAGTLPQAETQLVAGSGYQTHSAGRWGDYSMMAVDPTDGCTFWYTQEYYAGAGVAPWRTRIGAFKYAGCTSAPVGTIQGTVTDQATSSPLPDVKVEVSGGILTYTDDQGVYHLYDLPVGSYDVTASKYGYSPQTASAVEVQQGQVITQDFALAPVTNVTTHGRVTDGSGHAGMPLYARLDISGHPDSPVFTDPVTGEYSLQLLEGQTYTFTVSAVSQGYQDEVRVVIPLVGGGTQDFALQADLVVCSAPGYQLITALGLQEDFDTGSLPAGWSHLDHTGGGAWVFDDPGARGNLTGGEGGFAILDSDYYGAGAAQDAELRSPLVDLSGFSQAVLHFNTDFLAYSSEIADVDLSVDGGATWSNLWQKSMTSWRGPAVVALDISALAAGQPDVKVRFHYYSAEFDYWWQVDDVAIGDCRPLPGGLLVGNVRDANTSAPLNAARVVSQDAPQDQALALATPDDPGQEDGFFSLFSALTGLHPFEATYEGYGPIQHAVAILTDGVVRQDFDLPAGQLVADPTGFSVTLKTDEATTRTLTLDNTGGLAAGYTLWEMDAPAPGDQSPDGPFADGGRRISPKHLNDRDSGYLYLPDPPPAEPLAAGQIISQWPTGLAYAWGIGFNTLEDDLWLGNIPLSGGDGLDYRFLKDGTNTGDTIDISSWVAAWGADMAFDPLTGMLWQLNVGGDNCLYELDPANKVSTGEAICPPFGVSQRGLAFDPATDTFYAGSWNDGIVYHFKPDGTLLDSKYVGLNIAGLAYSPATKHLFASTNSDTGFDIYIMDAGDNYRILGGFNVQGLNANDQAGLEIDCAGHLWAVDQKDQIVFEVDSGESGVCDWADIPWLSAVPLTGSISPAGNQAITLTFDATSLAAGTYAAHLRVVEDTPYAVPPIPLTLVVEGFADLALSIEDRPDPVAAGQLLGYTLGVSNAGPSGAGSVLVELDLPVGASLVSVSPSQGSCTGLPCDLGSLPAGESATVHVLVEVDLHAPSPLVVSAEVSADSLDPEPTNNIASAQTRVYPGFFLPVVKR